MADFNWKGGFEGAAGGASAGAAFGPYGALIGGAAGGLLGGYGGGDENDKYQQMMEAFASQAAGRRAPQGSAVGAGYSQLRGNRAALIAQLEAQARGQGPSAAAIQMRDAMDRAAGAQASAAAGAGGRGINTGAALRNAMNNTAAIQAQGARDTATMRAQEQLSAQQQLGTNIGYGINADQDIMKFNAGAQNAMTQANMQAMLQQLGLNDAAQLAALQAAMGKASPGMGAGIMAGGASAAPFLMQMMNKGKTGTGQAG